MRESVSGIRKVIKIANSCFRLSFLCITMTNLKLTFEVNQNGKVSRIFETKNTSTIITVFQLVFPFSRRVLELPKIEYCRQLRNLVAGQGNNFFWLYTGQYEKIQFKTTERELDEILERYAIKKNTRSRECNDATSNYDSENMIESEDDDNVQWIMD